MHCWLTTTLIAPIVAVVLWLLKYGAFPQVYDHDRFRTQSADRLHHFDAFATGAGVTGGGGVFFRGL